MSEEKNTIPSAVLMKSAGKHTRNEKNHTCDEVKKSKNENEKMKTVSPVMKPVTGEIEKITGVDFEEIIRFLAVQTRF
jgi:hypothetical protein